MKHLFIILLSLKCVYGYCHDFNDSEYFSNLDLTKYEIDLELAKLESIEIDNGINKWEALTVGYIYATSNIEGCGIVEMPISKGEYWLIKPVSQSHEIDGFVKIHKKTGLITFKEKSKTSEEVLENVIRVYKKQKEKM